MLQVSLSDLFCGFARIGLSGFGGVMPWARRAVVEQHHWLSSEEFTALVGLCQFLPGPNIVNLSILVGARFQGWLGSVVASLGLMLAPFCVVLGMGMLYERFGDLPAIQSMLGGISAVGAGLILALGLRMAADLSRHPVLIGLAGVTLISIAALRWPLPAVILGLAPLCIWIAARKLANES